MQIKKLVFEKDAGMNGISSDKGGRRKIEERRQFAYTYHIPERRNGTDRRNGEDRRHSHREAENSF